MSKEIKCRYNEYIDNSRNVLMAKIVLEENITIKAGESLTLEIGAISKSLKLKHNQHEQT